jgi:hypothetical protein
MSNSQITVEEFRILALERFRFLEDFGFRRAPSLEEASPTGGTVVYLGKHVGFIFSLDVRDQCVDAQVVKVLDGQMKRRWEGGYSSGLFMHLVRHTGYRGGMPRSSGDTPSQAGRSALRQMIDGWAELLKHAGQTLLNDRPDSLP